jgi:5-amino-6-(5-phosphoribosylamino)uracil reductase
MTWRERFDAYVERKTREAADATLPPYLTALDVADESVDAIGNPWSIAVFDGPFYASPPRDPRKPACSLVFVQSADGNTVTSDPASFGGGETDKHAIYEGLSRVGADAVLAGAETVRAGHIVFSVWHPQLIELRASLGRPRHPTQIVATLRGLDLDRNLLFNVPEVPVVLLTVSAAAQQMKAGLDMRPWLTPLIMETPQHLPRAFDELRGMGIERISCIGGRTLAGHLLDANLVDEVYLTTGTREAGTPGTPMYEKPWRGNVLVRKRGTGAETGVVFEHAQVTETPHSPRSPPAQG